MALPKILQYTQDISDLTTGDLLKYDGSKLVKAVDGTDYITAISGTTDGWDWIKYSDGRAECRTIVSPWMSADKAWGNLYESSVPFTLPNFPFTFAAIPYVDPVARASFFIDYSSGTATTTSPGKLYIVRPNSVTGATFWALQITATGRWK